MLTGPFFEPNPEPKPPAPNPWQPPCQFNSTRGMLPIGSNNKTHGPLVEQAEPLLGHHQGIVMPNISRLMTEPVRLVVADPLFPALAVEAAPPLMAPARPSSVVFNSSLLTMKAVRPEILDMPFLPPSALPPISQTAASRPPLRHILPSRMSLVIKVLCSSVGVYFISDLMVVLSAVLSTFGGMTRKIKAAFSCLKDWIFAKIKMIQWLHLRPHPSNLEVVLVEPSQLPGNPEEDDSNTTEPEVTNSRPIEGRVTVIFPAPRRLVNSEPQEDKEEGKEEDKVEDKLEDKEEQNPLPPDPQEKDSADKSDSDDTTEVLVLKVKNGLMGRVIGKKGCIVKTMKRDLNLCIMYGNLDVGCSFFRVEGPSSGVNAAKTMIFQRVKSGLEEIDPMEIAHRVSQERIISVQYTYSRCHHGRVVGKDARCLKGFRAMGVKTMTNTVGELNHLELTGNATNVREVQLWIMENMDTPLFATIPDLIEAPKAQAEDDEGASASAAAGPE
ncbi:uncharacterized protein LOC119730097 [Patiria miniata]|uniref:K Homology domain-containing protein n=1 Tax=Patiria miniata TaxID=46514 RepID=A0A914A4R6_PATMI|nr:uncharacterized protein LOC119730097 [Patiria miniata]